MAGTELSHIDYWDVGQGDCTALHLSNGEIILIDTGKSSSPVVDWLAKRPKSIYAIVLTHNDADHAGALCSLVGAHAERIRAVYILDYPRDEPKFRDLFACVYAAHKKHNILLERAEAGSVVWISGSGDTSLKILHPNFVQQVTAPSSNASSALVVLEHAGQILSVWPGDLKFATIVQTVGEARVEMLVGPHHGGVKDTKVELKALRKNFVPAQAFISVGTSNSYQHPKAPYLKLLLSKGCYVTCSELTEKCDSLRVFQAQPVFDGSAMLGLPSNPSGISCRGTRRILFKNGSLEGSRFDDMHRAQVEKLSSPLCLRFQAS
jgi:beta-lactamase superfamily II metal-dependent hydrolase